VSLASLRTQHASIQWLHGWLAAPRTAPPRAQQQVLRYCTVLGTIGRSARTLCLVSANIEEHKRQWRHLIKVLEHIRLKISPDKTKIGRKYLNFLGHCVSPEVTFANLSKVSGMQNVKGPTLQDPWSKTDVRSWCGAVSYYKCYIPDFSSMTRPLHCLTHDSVKPDSNLTSHWTKRLDQEDPDYHTHNVTLKGEKVPAMFDEDKQRRELTCQEGFDASKAALCK
jgi:transposase InsO family protein